MKFIIAIEPGSDSTAWGVVVPDLPGCFSAGDTLDEALDNARQAIDQHVEVLMVLARIDEYARAHGMSRRGFLVEAARSAMQA